jgi:hypothetical protein
LQDGGEFSQTGELIMDGLYSKRWSYFAYLIGGMIYFIGAVRFIARNDGVGALILAVTGSLAIILAAVGYSRRKG